ncbi:MAG: ABC transporter ATP-binding protein [Burkholderiaceae bacterium]
MKKKGLRYFLRYGLLLKSQSRQVVLAYTFSIAGVGFSLAIPWPLKILIDNVLAGEPTSSFFYLYSGTIQVLVLAGLMLFLALVSALTLSAEKIQHARVREQFGYDLRDQLVQKVYKLSRFSRQAERSGELTMRLSSDVQQVSRLFCKTASTVMKYTGITVCSLVAIFLISIPLGVLSLALAAILANLMVWYGPKVSAASKRKRQLEGAVAALTQETIRGVEHVQAMGLENQSRKRYLLEAAASLAAGVEETRVAVQLERTTQFIAGIALACIAGAGGLMVLNGELTLGLLTVCLAYINALLKPIEKINELAMSISQGLVRVERIEETFEAQTSIDHSDNEEHQSFIGRFESIECKDIIYQYPDNKSPTITHFSHRFTKGESTVIVGKSGSGKSTILRLLLRLLTPDSGEISANGTNYKQIEPSSLRSQCAVVMQESHLYAGTIRDVLTELSPDADDQQLREALKVVELLSLVDQMADGLDSSVDESASQLSGGQKTRLMLARALVSQRAVLILDEPFANIDDESKRVIATGIKKIKSQCILIVVTHEDSLREIADHILCPEKWRTKVRKTEMTNAGY